jgi:hypothetical protein
MEILIFLVIMYFVLGEMSDYARIRREQAKNKKDKR